MGAAGLAARLAGPDRDVALRRLVLVLLVLGNVAFVWATPLLPGHDLPKHVAGARLLAELGHSPLFDAYFVRRPGLIGYYGFHGLFGTLGGLVGLMAALKLLYSAYVVLFFVGFDYLVRAVHRAVDGAEGPPPWSAFLGVLVLWSPIVLFGFLPFMLALPLLFLAVGLLVRAARPDARWGRYGLAGAATLPVALVHPLAGLAVVWLAILLAATARRRQALLAAAAVTLPVALLVGGMALAMGTHAPVKEAMSWERVVRESGGLEVVPRYLGLEWANPFLLAEYVALTIFGPYRPGGMAVTAGALAATVFAAWRAGRGATPAAPTADPAFRRAVLWFTLSVVILAPEVTLRPERIQYVGLRMLTVALGLLLALVPPAWFRPRAPRLALVGLALVLTVHFGVNAVRFGWEQAPVLALMSRALPPGVLHSLPAHGKSPYFARQFYVSGQLPHYYMAFQGGVAAQFEPEPAAPVRYRRQRPFEPEIAGLWDLRPEFITPGGYALVERPRPGDPQFLIDAVPRIMATLEQGTDPLGCAGSWCLYRSRRRPPSGGAAGGG